MTLIDSLQERPDTGERTADSGSGIKADPGKPADGRARVVEELRHLLPRMSETLGEPRALSFGEPAIDRHLQGRGLAFGALHEIVPANDGDAPAAFGFTMALIGRLPSSEMALCAVTKRWLARQGLPCGHGLNALGFDPSRVIFAQTAEDKDTLWVLEEALRANALTAVAGVVERLDLKTSQKLQFTARETGQPLLLLRPARTLEASAATTRWRIGAAQAARDRFGLIVRWRWRLRLERCRNGRGGEWLVEFDHVTHRFSLHSTLAGSKISGSADAQSRQHAG